MRAITWVKPRGAEFAEVDLSDGRLRADITVDADGIVADYPEIGWLA